MVFKNTKIILAFTLSILLLGEFTACTKRETKRELRLYTWSEYFPDSVLREFEKEYNVQVKADYFSSNEQLLTKLQLSINSADTGYDLILPSDYAVAGMVELKLLKPLDKTKLNFLNDFDPAFLHPPYDKNLEYTIPMASGTTGIAVNTSILPNVDPTKLTWKDFFENPAYEGKATLLNDQKEVLQVALLIKGKNLATASEQDIKDAFTYLKAHKNNIRAFTDETKPVIEAGDCGLCHVYSGEGLSAQRSNPKIRYVIPKEGATIWTDNFAIPRNAKNDDLAYAFINKALSTENAKRFMENMNYQTMNTKAKAQLPKELAENPFLFPSAKLGKKLYYINVKKEFTLLLDRGWTELKSQ